ncbi:MULTISPECIES: glucose 1-dehydrogenase [Mesorhizobium]|uniref:glucose 1-dehydrogenase n=1 Tax=Mesorhizobium TaxID=68287 RepID=UPI0007ED152D|nr:MULTISPECIES: glucose 1-dehydrogenase [Mesorhizobium]PBB52930.1 3-oxoacyl-ACP reductase [Mesorhizobium loti]QIA22536.1 SDR family oxidoreductase [Mesorhizobium sp. AA22]
MRGLTDKRVLITGAAQGIGRATAMRFAEEGSIVILNDLSGSDTLHETATSITDLYGADRVGGIIPADLSDPTQVGTMFNQAVALAGQVDILINNAGINREHPSHEFPIEDFDAVLNLNLRAVFVCSKLAVRHFLSRHSAGVILNNSSNHEIIPKPNFIAYATSKGGLGMLMRTLALEYAAQGIRVNNVAPGATVTPLNRNWVFDADKRAAVEKHIPLGRIADADEVAAAFAFLASEDARYITGQTLYVDGGLTIYPDYRKNWAS